MDRQAEFPDFHPPFGGKLYPGFRQRFGHYPASIHDDKIDQSRANRAWCKERGIRLSGKPLGRPREMTREEKVHFVPIEGKFGYAKRKGMLQRVMTKLAVIGRTVVAIGLIVLNLDQWLRSLRALIPGLRSSWQAIPVQTCLLARF